MLHQSDLACSRSGLVPGRVPGATSKSGERSNQSFYGGRPPQPAPPINTPTHTQHTGQSPPKPSPAGAGFPGCDVGITLTRGSRNTVPFLESTIANVTPASCNRTRQAHQSPGWFPPGERLRQPVLTRPPSPAPGGGVSSEWMRSRGGFSSPPDVRRARSTRFHVRPLILGRGICRRGMRGPEGGTIYKLCVGPIIFAGRAGR